MTRQSVQASTSPLADVSSLTSSSTTQNNAAAASLKILRSIYDSNAQFLAKSREDSWASAFSNVGGFFHFDAMDVGSSSRQTLTQIAAAHGAYADAA